jgi:predicted TIM-barrel fold metal-dependent hydrolase
MPKVIDFHIHYTPEDLVRPNLGDGGRPKVTWQDGVPRYTQHEGLFRIDRHLECMDAAGIDVAVLSSGSGMGADHETCAFINADLAKVGAGAPGRFRPLCHVDPRDDRWRREIQRCADEYGFSGLAFPSSFGSVQLDDILLRPVFEEATRRGMFVFIHPSLAVPPGFESYYDRYDLYRCVGREHELIVATVRLIAGRVFDQVPGLQVVMSHLGGGIAAIIERIRGYQDKAHLGLPADSPHGQVADRPFDHYFDRNMYFDTGGVFGSVNAIRAALTEIRPERIVLGTDYPQEIRDADKMAGFTRDLRSSGLDEAVIEGILGGNGAHLIAEDAATRRAPA